jgi:hypothetical protein
MTTTIDTDNPNVARSLQLPPQLLEAIQDDPEQMQPLARAMAAVLANDLFVARDSMTPVQKQALMESFAKLGNLQPKDKNAVGPGASFSIQINIPEVGAQKATSNIIEASYEEVQLPSILGGVSEERQVHQSGGGSGGVDKDDDLDHQDTD